MASWTTTQSGSWSRTSDNADSPWYDGVGGTQTTRAAVPADNDGTITIASGHSVLMDSDQSLWTSGCANVVIQGGATPGMLYFANGTNGYLVIKTGCTLAGTTSTNRGRLLANSNGTWGTTTGLQASNKAVISLLGTAYIAATNLDIALYCTEPAVKYTRTYGQIFHECTVDATGDTLTYTGLAAAIPNGTLVRVSAGSGALPAELAANTDYWVVNASGNTVKLATAYGGSAINLSAGGPINIHVGLYTNWSISGNTLTKTAHGLAIHTAVMFRSSGTLPTPLKENVIYYIYSVPTADSITLKGVPNGTGRQIILGGSPSGQLDMYTASTGAVGTTGVGGIGGTNPYTSIKVNCIDDVTADGYWATTSGNNVCALVNGGPQICDQQRTTMAAITSNIITLSNTIDSIQLPFACLFLVSRNVRIISNTTSTSVYLVEYNLGTHTGIFNCEFYNSSSLGTTFYGVGIHSSTISHVGVSFGGIMAGLYRTFSIVNTTCTGIIVACQYGILDGDTTSITSLAGCIIAGCQYGVSISGSFTSDANCIFINCTNVIYNSICITTATFNGVVYGGNVCIISSKNITINATIYNESVIASINTNLIFNGIAENCNTCFSINGSCIINGTISYCNIVDSAGYSNVINSAISQCYVVLNNCAGNFVSGTISTSTVGIMGGSYILSNCTFTGCTTDLYHSTCYICNIIGYNVTLGGATQVSNYLYNSIPGADVNNSFVIYDLGGISGAIGSWTQGGYCKSAIYSAGTHGTPPIPNAFIHEQTFQDNRRNCFTDLPNIYAKQNQPIDITFYGQLTTTSDWTTLPRVYICDNTYLYNTPGEIVASGIMASSTDWQTLNITYTPPSDRSLKVRVTGCGGDTSGTGTGKLYWFNRLGPPVPGGTTGEVVLSKETGANARGGSGTCAKLLPSSTVSYGFWTFYVAATDSTSLTLSFYHKITSGFNGGVKCTIYDTDGTTKLLTSEIVSLTDDSDYHQYTATPVTPTNTGLCRVDIEVVQGAVAGSVYVDDIGVA